MKKLNNALFSIIVFLSLGYAQGTNGISLDFKNSDIHEVMKTLSEKIGRNIIIQNDVDVKINVKLDKIEPMRAFTLICQTHKLNWIEEKDVLIVFSRSGYAAEGVHESHTNAYIVIKNRSAREVFDKITVKDQKAAAAGEKDDSGIGISPYGDKLFFDLKDNSLTVIGPAENIKRLQETITVFDTPIRQVLIEAKIVKINLSDTQSFGIDWSKLGHSKLSTKFPGVGESGLSINPLNGNIPLDKINALGGLANILKLPDALSFEGVIKMVAQDNKIDIMSNPRITAINGEEAKIIVGRNVPYKTVSYAKESGASIEDVKFIEAGIKLIVTPSIYGETVKLKVHPEVSTAIVDEKSIAPTLDTSEADSVIYLKSGQAVVLGGLIEEEDSLIKSQIPVLGNIPILGWLFRSTEKRKIKKEMVVFIKVEIMP